MIPYAAGEKPWERQQIKKVTYLPTACLLRQAAIAYREPAYERALGRTEGVTQDNLRWIDLLYPPPSLPVDGPVTAPGGQ